MCPACHFTRRSQWPRSVRRCSAAVRMLGMRVRTPPEARPSVSFKCCLLSDRGLWFGLITRPEESYWEWCAWVWPWKLITKFLEKKVIADFCIYSIHSLPQAPRSCSLWVTRTWFDRRQRKGVFLIAETSTRVWTHSAVSPMSSGVHTTGVKLPVCQNGHWNCQKEWSSTHKRSWRPRWGIKLWLFSFFNLGGRWVGR